MSKGRLYTLASVFLLIVHCAASLPLSAIVNWADLRAHKVDWYKASGTIWGGEIEALHFNGHYLGKLRQRTSLLGLLTAKISSRYSLTGGPALSSGQITVTPWGSVGVKNTQIQLDLARFNIRDAFDAPMRGLLEIRIKELKFANNKCEQAEFEIWTNALLNSATRYGGQGFDLSGQGRCEDGTLIVPLSGRGPNEAVYLDVEVDAAFNYEARVRVQSQTADLIAALKLYGFDTQGEDLVLIQRGNFAIPR